MLHSDTITCVNNARDVTDLQLYIDSLQITLQYNYSWNKQIKL